jgi:hypothetical protein
MELLPTFVRIEGSTLALKIVDIKRLNYGEKSGIGRP